MFTTCFRECHLEGRSLGEVETNGVAERDSAKDQAVVFIFIIATVGLLSYAAVRPWIDQWAEVSSIFAWILNPMKPD